MILKKRNILKSIIITISKIKHIMNKNYTIININKRFKLDKKFKLG